jgi:hypothetical protein
MTTCNGSRCSLTGFLGTAKPTQLEAVAQHADEEEANCDHQSQSCSDSLPAVTLADGVFGSDKGIWRNLKLPLR